MGEAFDFLDEYFWSVNDDPASEAPDEAFDWIFMMKPDDWNSLESVMEQRPPGWREECAYVLGEGPIDRCKPLLERVVWDLEFDVARQAAESLAALMLGQEALVLLLESSLRERLELLRDLRSPCADDALSQLLKQAKCRDGA